MNTSTHLALDHLLIAAPELQAGCDYTEELLGVRPVPGGSHPGIGTRNALLGLEDNIYLEIIAPDPEQDAELPMHTYLRGLKAPAFMWWAARCSDIEQIQQSLRAQNLDIGRIQAWSRALSHERSLSWKMLMPKDESLGAALPFYIQWDDMKDHPTNSMLPSGKITSFRVIHKNTKKLPPLIPGRCNLSTRGQPGVFSDVETAKGTVRLAVQVPVPPAFGSVLSGSFS